MSIKIGIIGAGSATFSLNLIKDICLTPNLKDSKICLMDVNSERLNIAYELCLRYAAEVNIHLDIEKTTDRITALKDADYVINTALATGPGWRRLQDGWDIAKKYGYRFGGSLHIMHDEAFWINFYQFQLMESILVDILEYCPEAWYILVANPVQAGITYLTRKYPQAKIVGMCHGYSGIYKVAEAMGLNREDIYYEIPGVNHFVWLNRFEYQGKDAMPLLSKWVKDNAEKYFESCGYCNPLGPKAVDLYKRFGLLPVGDTGNPGGGAWGYWYHENSETESKWKEDVQSWFYIDYFKNVVDRNDELMRRVLSDPNARVMDAFPGEFSDEPMIPLIESLAFDIERTIIVNIPNTENLIESVPLDYEVEVPAIVNGKGISGLKTKKLPDDLLSFMMRDYVVPVELEIRAFESGSKATLLNLILMDPWTRDITQAEKFLDEILDMPSHEELRMHYA